MDCEMDTGVVPCQLYSRNSAGFCRRIHQHRAIKPPPGRIPALARAPGKFIARGQGVSGENNSDARARISCIFSGRTIPIVSQIRSFSSA